MLAQDCLIKNQDFTNIGLNNSICRIDALDIEIQVLAEAKDSLLEIEKTLWFNIEEEFKSRKQKRELLKAEITELMNNCNKLLYFVNTFRQE